jgi:hypothetical protein
MRYAVCDSEGSILRILYGPLHYVECDESVSDDTHYFDVKEGEIKIKLDLDVTYNVNGLSVTLYGIPDGMTVETNSTLGFSDGDNFEITYDVPGDYNVTISGLANYKEKELEVTVGDA